MIGELETASDIADFSGAVRIRIGDYRLGIALERDVAILVRFLHRRDVYRFFP